MAPHCSKQAACRSMGARGAAVQSSRVAGGRSKWPNTQNNRASPLGGAGGGSTLRACMPHIYQVPEFLHPKRCLHMHARRFKKWVDSLLWDREARPDEIYRCKGVLHVAGSSRKHLFQVCVRVCLCRA